MSRYSHKKKKVVRILLMVLITIVIAIVIGIPIRSCANREYTFTYTPVEVKDNIIKLDVSYTYNMDTLTITYSTDPLLIYYNVEAIKFTKINDTGGYTVTGSKRKDFLYNAFYTFNLDTTYSETFICTTSWNESCF